MMGVRGKGDDFFSIFLVGENVGDGPCNLFSILTVMMIEREFQTSKVPNKPME